MTLQVGSGSVVIKDQASLKKNAVKNILFPTKDQASREINAVKNIIFCIISFS